VVNKVKEKRMWVVWQAQSKIRGMHPTGCVAGTEQMTGMHPAGCVASMEQITNMHLAWCVAKGQHVSGGENKV
jgi:hypothetical protein